MSHIYLDEIHEFLELNLESTEIESLCCVKVLRKLLFWWRWQNIRIWERSFSFWFLNAWMEYFQVEHRLQRSIGEHKMWRGRQSFELNLLFCKQINDINNVTDKMMKHWPPCFFSSSFLSLFFAKYPQILGANVNCRSMWFGNSCARQVLLDYLLGDNKDLTMNVNWMSDPGWIIVFTCPKIKTSIGKSRTNNLKYKSHLLLTILCKNDKVV